MYTWKDKIWNRITTSIVIIINIPLIIVMIPIIGISMIVDKIWPTDYKNRLSHWQM